MLIKKKMKIIWLILENLCFVGAVVLCGLTDWKLAIALVLYETNIGITLALEEAKRRGLLE